MQKISFIVFVGLTLFILTGCTTFNQAIQNNTKTEANKQLTGFPSDLPDTYAVEKIEVKDAKKVVVILYQLDTRLQYLNENVISEMEAVQNDLYAILSYLVDQKITQSVYYGYTSQNVDRNIPKNLVEVSHYVDEHLARNNLVVSQDKRLQLIMFINGIISINNYFNRIDAVHRLTYLKKINRIPANKDFAHKGAILTGLSPLFASKNGAPNDHYKEFFEKVGRDKNDLIVTIGSINDHIPNAVEWWNDMQKDSKISLIMVFPRAMKNHINDFLS